MSSTPEVLEGSSEAQQQQQKSTSSFTQRFSLSFWNALTEKELKNAVVSPISVLAAFSMILGAARGHSLEELKAALHVDDALPFTDEQNVHEYFQNLLESLPPPSESSDPRREFLDKLEMPLRAAGVNISRNGLHLYSVLFNRANRHPTHRRRRWLCCWKVKCENTLKIRLENGLRVDEQLSDEQVELMYNYMRKFKEAPPEAKINYPNGIVMANRLFVRAGFPLEQDFLSLVKTFYKSEIVELNFEEAATSAEIINSWVNESTRGKITKLVEESSIGADTHLILANAIYFKGTWVHLFKETEMHPFHLLDGSIKEVPTMFQAEDFRVFENIPDLNASAVELPFEGNRFSLVILVPAEINGLAAVESALNHDVVDRIMEGLDKNFVILSLPKFKVESTCRLNDIMTQLGAKSIFDCNNADLSGITKNEKLFVSNAVHKAILSVNEYGAEAGAATDYSLTLHCFREPSVINVDRPFLTWIWDSQSKLILFMARVCSP